MDALFHFKKVVYSPSTRIDVMQYFHGKGSELPSLATLPDYWLQCLDLIGNYCGTYVFRYHWMMETRFLRSTSMHCRCPR